MIVITLGEFDAGRLLSFPRDETKSLLLQAERWPRGGKGCDKMAIIKQDRNVYQQGIEIPVSRFDKMSQLWRGLVE
jgi:hypothetical protein